MADNDLGTLMSSLGVSPVSGAKTPLNFQWQHAADRLGVMQLVPMSQHSPSSKFQYVLHPNGKGGYANWGRSW